MSTAASFNVEYRHQLAAHVKGLPRDKHGRISFADFDRLDAQIKADRASGLITHSDFFNCGCLIGSAVNIAPHRDPRIAA